MNNMYDVTWDSPSTKSADSMPLGGHDVGCNVWAEAGEVMLYASQSGAFDENGTLLKMCRLRLDTDPTLMEKGFRQTLHLNDGYISIDMGNGDDTVQYTLWCAVEKSELHIEYKFSNPHTISVGFDTWRWRDRQVTSENEEVHQCRDYSGSPYLERGEIFTKADSVYPDDTSLMFLHSNKSDGETLRDRMIHLQHCEPFADTVPDVMGNRKIGGILNCPGFHYRGCEEASYQGVDSRLYRYVNDSATSGEIILTLSVEQCAADEIWKTNLTQKSEMPVSFEKNKKWWNDYFAKSYIIIDEEHPDTKWFKVGKNYQLFRYMLGCNYYGKWPTKFNGGLFTFDEGRTPDFRMWAGINHTAQNQRLVYWPMLKSGDFEAMKPQFDYYKNITPVSKARTKYYYGHGGAAFYEQGTALGLSAGGNYGWDHSDKLSYGDVDWAWVRLHYSTGLEFALMILQYHRYSGKDISEYMEFVESTVDFYAEHYQKDENGKLFIFPSAALETYRGDFDSKINEKYGCANPTDAVSGLRCVSDELMAYYKDRDCDKYNHFKEIRESCPEIPVSEGDETKYFTPAETFNPTPFNTELPQLYPVFPYSPRGLSVSEKELAVAAYYRKYPSRNQYLAFGWHQNGVFAARLGLLSEAEKYLRKKFADAPKRFPAFWGPGHDWTPDHNHGGCGMIILQEMLLQCEGEDDVLFLPTWNKKIDVSFRLYVPGGKVAECVLKDGKIIRKEIMDA